MQQSAQRLLQETLMIYRTIKLDSFLLTIVTLSMSRGYTSSDYIVTLCIPQVRVLNRYTFDRLWFTCKTDTKLSTCGVRVDWY